MRNVLRVIFLLLSAAGIVWFVAPVHWNVWNIGNQFGVAVCALIFLAALFFPQIHELGLHHPAVRNTARTLAVLFCLGVVWSAVLTFLMFCVHTPPPPADATVVVLGSKAAGTTPSADLRVRIETAAAYLKAHPDAKCVASGGQGGGESKSEAAIIRDGLQELGIDPSRVLLEDKSVNTQQNLANTMEIIDKNSLSTSLAIVTDDYHEYRACSIARRLDATSRYRANPYAVPAKTPSYIFSACWARELLALTAYFA